MDKPFVSIILPVCNSVEHLRSCMESLKAQAFQNFEVIAIDDKSSDSSFSLLRRFKKEDSRLRLYRNVKRYGLATTLNRAVRKAKGTIIAFLDPATVVDPSCLQKSLEMLENTPKAVAVTTQCATHTEDGHVQLSQESEKSPVAAGSIHCQFLITHKKRVPKDLLWFKQKKLPFVYTDIFLKLPTYGEVLTIPEFLHTHTIKRLEVGRLKLFLFLCQLWFSFRNADSLRPTLRSLFFPLVNLR